MAAQEFSSPGDHMASSAKSNVSSSNVIYAPPTINNKFNSDYFKNSVSNSLDYDMYVSDSHRFNQKYIDYNNKLFQNAIEYDKYMSNTAIQRQVSDLKKAGLNPVLAASLGGAQWKGVSMPYATITPSTSLQALQGIYSSNLDYEINEINNNARRVLDFELQDRDFKHSFDILVEELKNYEKMANIDVEKLKQSSKYDSKSSLWGLLNSLIGRTNTYNILEKDNKNLVDIIKDMLITAYESIAPFPAY